MERQIILDTGPLVAYLDIRQEHHRWVTRQFARIDQPLITCEAVLTEACFLLASFPRAIEMIAKYLREGVVHCEFTFGEKHERVFALMEQYRNVPMSFADACVFCMAEANNGSRIFTLDSDFHIYRLRDRKPVPLIIPH